MHINEGDYLIVEVDNEKRMVRVQTKDNMVLCDKQSIKRDDYGQAVELEHDSIIANLGDDPKPGRAYGIGCEPVLSRIATKGFGYIYFLRKLPKREKRLIVKTFNKAFVKFKKLGILPYKAFNIYVMPYKKSSMMTGSYLSYRSETKADELTLFTESYSSLRDVRYVVFHELSHAVWFSRLDADIRADWIEAYDANIEKLKFGGNKLKSIRQALKEVGKISLLRKMLDEDDREVLKEILRFIARVHKLDPTNIDELLSVGRSIRGIWPDDPVELSKKITIISEYANTNPEEYFAEAMGFFLVGEKLPKSIKALVDSTLKRAPHIAPPEPTVKHKKVGEDDDAD
jgi:hypothetical protein